MFIVDRVAVPAGRFKFVLTLGGVAAPIGAGKLYWVFGFLCAAASSWNSAKSASSATSFFMMWSSRKVRSVYAGLESRWHGVRESCLSCIQRHLTGWPAAAIDRNGRTERILKAGVDRCKSRIRPGRRVAAVVPRPVFSIPALLVRGVDRKHEHVATG